MVAKLTSSIEELVCRADDAERVVAKLTSSVEELVCRADDAKRELAQLWDARGAGPAPSSEPPRVPEPPCELTSHLCAPDQTNFGLHEEDILFPGRRRGLRAPGRPYAGQPVCSLW